MTETTPDYITNEDHGDETDVRLGAGADAPPLPGTWVGRFDAAYWQGQAEQAHAAVTAAWARVAKADQDRDTAMQQVMPLYLQAQQAHAERDAARAQLASVKRQLAVTGDTLYAERRAAVAQQRRSHLD